MPSPPQSPPLAAYNSHATKRPASNNGSRSGRARRGGAAYTITEECERLFCETLKAVFLGEGNAAVQDSLVAGVQNYNNITTTTSNFGSDPNAHARYAYRTRGLPSPEMDGFGGSQGLVTEWVEMFDYVGGIRFRGFVAEKDGERAMFVFFDNQVVGNDLKPGLMALLELCDIPSFECSQLVVCLDRHTESHAMSALSRDLGWVGFSLTTLDGWTNGDEITSDSWIFMGMDV
ncbi:uncharacterized protein BDZ99DRAFT_464813 [Mytilinidion resinicola]|uniref:Ornithine decarboxylase antizyme n=1 Tax=Mytilinidion resinicola TaxID=574789 RepID=A0A6A6YJ18_9PEZI|nr:uncharacterized protein BDZ99DRAFT_464813 [Mytilinidion resinicola]KAF2807917.1 hypothetical protein BDZ99DRAFT_464813 [Mytilinidion resinicola]